MIDTITRVRNGIIRHLGGHPWYEVPTPRRWHHCWATSIAVLNIGDLITFVERCACGARRHVDLTDVGEIGQNNVIDVLELDGDVTNVLLRVRRVDGIVAYHDELYPWRERNTRRTGTATFITLG